MTTDISVGVRWDPLSQSEVIEDYEFDYDGGNSSSRLFERSRIKALAGKKSRPLSQKIIESHEIMIFCLYLRLRVLENCLSELTFITNEHDRCLTREEGKLFDCR